MKFSEVVAQTLAWLQREGRVSYRALRLEFDLTEDVLDALKEELIEVKELAVDKDGKMLVWTGASSVPSSKFQVPSSPPPPAPQTPNPELRTSQPPAAERRQLTVLFCDLVGSTALSEQLDPEEYREVVRAYQQSSAAVIDHYEGHIVQYLGDGLLVYFGYPAAHEDDAQRAVRTALGVVEAVQQLPFPTIQLPRPLQVRIGIHTGLVVVGEIGVGEQPEPLAIVGETPNIAARLQEKAPPNGVVISPTTYRLVTGLFECEELGPQTLKGLSAPLVVYGVVGESETQSRFEVAVRTGLTPL